MDGKSSRLAWCSIVGIPRRKISFRLIGKSALIPMFTMSAMNYDDHHHLDRITPLVPQHVATAYTWLCRCRYMEPGYDYRQVRTTAITGFSQWRGLCIS